MAPSSTNTNPHHSTGPRTPEGKARSSQNACKSGWFARDLRVAEDKIETYLAFEESWREELAPEGLRENELFADFLRAAWHKREIIDAQNELTASSPLAFLDSAIEKKLDRLHRYEKEFERRGARCLADLHRLRQERSGRHSRPADSQKRTLPARPANLPDEILGEIQVMDAQTRHWNAQLRARKAGLLPPPPPPAQPPAASATI